MKTCTVIGTAICLLLALNALAKEYKADTIADWERETLREMNCPPNWGSDGAKAYLRRGRSWRTDTYPAPGARIPMIGPNGEDLYPNSKPGTSQMMYWPYQGYTNLRPE